MGLDDFFPAIDDTDDQWQRSAISDPRSWYKADNPITERLRMSLCMDQGIDIRDGGEARRTTRAVAADILKELGGFEIAFAALESCRRNPRWRNLNLHVQKKAILLEAAKQKYAKRPDPYICEACHQIPCVCDDEPRRDLR